MSKNKDNGSAVIIAIVILIIFWAFIISLGDSDDGLSITKDKTFRLISATENKVFDKELKEAAKKEKIKLDITYDDTLNITSELNNGDTKYDAVWLSNSIWMYTLDSSKVTTTNSKSTSINPIVFGIKKSKAEELGFIGKDVYTKDIVDAVKSGKLKFTMSNPTSTNSGASAYLGILSTLAGNPEVLTTETLEQDSLKSELKSFFTGLERSAGSEDFLEEAFIKSDYEAVFSYESSIININKELEKNNKETLYAIYPVDGVSISDSPIAYIDKKNDTKKEEYTKLQEYLLSNEGQETLAKYGRRTWYGGTTTKANKKVFNPKWGIDTTKYITPVKYPSSKVIKEALLLYQTQLRKPIHVVFALDYSGSMYGDGLKELRDAMNYILTDAAANDMLQFSNEDKVDVILFSSNIKDKWRTADGLSLDNILQNINNEYAGGGTAIYLASTESLNLLKDEDRNTYNTSVILMTDGMSNIGSYRDLENYYNELNKDIPIYSISFGEADEDELEKIAKLTNGKVFDGKKDLVKAFKEVRGYN